MMVLSFVIDVAFMLLSSMCMYMYVSKRWGGIGRGRGNQYWTSGFYYDV